MGNYIHRVVRSLDSEATEKMHADLSQALNRIQTLNGFALQEAIDIICNVILDLEEEFTEGETT